MPAGVIRVITGIGGSIPRPGANVWHASVADTTNANAQLVVDAIRDFYTTIAALYSNAVTLTIGTSVLVIDSTPPLILNPTPRIVVGSSIGASLPAQLAGVVSWRTPFAGRSFRGRNYFGPISSSALTANQITNAINTSMGSAAAALIAASGASANWSFVVWSEKLQVATEVGSGVANTKVETQRRRNR